MIVKVMRGVLALVFIVTLAILIGKQMAAEAGAVVIGVVCGVAAGIPTSVLLLVALCRREIAQQSRTAQDGSYWPTPNAAPLVERRFYVVGRDELEAGDGPGSVV